MLIIQLLQEEEEEGGGIEFFVYLFILPCRYLYINSIL